MVTVQIIKHSAAAVVVPDIIRWPEMFFRNHFPQTFEDWNLWSRAGFRVKAESAAILFVFIPVIGRYPIIRSIHLDTRRAGNRTDLAAGRIEKGPIWIYFL